MPLCTLCSRPASVVFGGASCLNCLLRLHERGIPYRDAALHPGLFDTQVQAAKAEAEARRQRQAAELVARRERAAAERAARLAEQPAFTWPGAQCRHCGRKVKSSVRNGRHILQQHVPPNGVSWCPSSLREGVPPVEQEVLS